MRRALLRRWPSLMRDYHLMPWQVGDLTIAELREVLADQEARWKAQRDQARKRG